MTGSAPGAPAARAASVDTPATGTSSASASTRVAARPIRTPVKLPGPVPTASASTWVSRIPPWRSSASRSARTVVAREERSPSTSPSQTSALAATSVAVSSASISTAEGVFERRVVRLQADQPTCARSVPKMHGRTRRWERARARLRPFDEDDRVLEVRLEIAPLLRRERVKPVQVEVRDVQAAVVAAADRERRARHRPVDAERAARTPDEGRLAGAELPGNRNDVARLQRRGEGCRETLGFLRRRRFDLHPGRVETVTARSAGLEEAELRRGLGHGGRGVELGE